MPRKSNYSRGRKSRNRGKWKQQKLAVGTVAKIARKVARFQIQKGEEPKFTNNILGEVAENSYSDPVRCIVTKSGLYRVAEQASGFLSNVSQTNLQHAPITYPASTAIAQPQPANLKLSSGSGYRIGDTIHLKAIALKGYLMLGKSCPNAKVSASFHKAEQTLTDPVRYLPPLNGLTIRRSIDDTEKLNGTKVHKTWMLNHKAENQEVKIPVNLYLRVDKRIRYNKNQPDVDAGVMDQIWYDDLRYYLILYSDVKDEVQLGGIGTNVPNAQLQDVIDRFPTFYGRWTAYYRDA